MTSKIKKFATTSPIDRREEGKVQDAREIIKEEALEGLRTFLEGVGFAGQSIDEATLAGAALVAAGAIVQGRPKWINRKKYPHLRDLFVPGFLREVYRDLIEGNLQLPDGRQIWHLQLPGGNPVWQEAVRLYDFKVVQILQAYINNTPNLAEVSDLIFVKRIKHARLEERSKKRRNPRRKRPLRPPIG